VATPFITAYNDVGPNLRSDIGGQLGFKFTVGGSSIVISELGRWKISGNSLSHTVYILDNAGSVVVSATVSGGSAGGFVYTTIADTTLSASTVYYCMSSETNGGDQWYDPNGSSWSTFGSGATFNNAVYQVGAIGQALNDSWTSDPYVPTNFKIGAGSGAGGGTTYSGCDGTGCFHHDAALFDEYREKRARREREIARIGREIASGRRAA
jgi:hypothetical protein